MKEYTLNGIKYGTEPDFWKWFYEGEYMNMFFMCHPNAKFENYITKLEQDLSEHIKSVDWANREIQSDSWLVSHSKKCLLVQIDVLQNIITNFKITMRTS